MKQLFTIGYALDMLKVLADNPYSALWKLVEDFVVNGHIVSVQRSNRLRHIIIDDVYYCISEDLTIVSNENSYSGLEYVKEILSKEVA